MLTIIIALYIGLILGILAGALSCQRVLEAAATLHAEATETYAEAARLRQANRLHSDYLEAMQRKVYEREPCRN